MFIYDYSSNYLKKYLFFGQKGDLYEYTYFSIGHCYHLIWFISF